MRIGVALLFLGITTAYSQDQSVDSRKPVSFSGYVKDQTGAVIPKATIDIEAKENIAMHTITDDSGHFAIEARPGAYTLKVASPGFRTYIEPIHLIDSSIQKDTVLQIGGGSLVQQLCPPSCWPPPIELLNISLTSTLPLYPFPPLKLHKRIAR